MKITDWLLPKADESCCQPGSTSSNSSKSKQSPFSNKDKLKNSQNENRSPSVSKDAEERSSFSNKSNSPSTPAMPPKEKTPSSSKQGGSRQSSGGQGSSKQTSSGGRGQGSSRQSGGSDRSSATGTTTLVAGQHSVVSKPEVVLPQAKVKVIMKSSPEIEQVGPDVVYMITKATELFIDHLTTGTFTIAHKAKNVEYRHLAEMTHKNDNLEFLRDIVPQKMTARAALAEMAKQKALASKELLE